MYSHYHNDSRNKLKHKVTIYRHNKNAYSDEKELKRQRLKKKKKKVGIKEKKRKENLKRERKKEENK